MKERKRINFLFSFFVDTDDDQAVQQRRDRKHVGHSFSILPADSAIIGQWSYRWPFSTISGW